MKISYRLSLLFLALFLTACGLEDGSEDDSEDNQSASQAQLEINLTPSVSQREVKTINQNVAASSLSGAAIDDEVPEEITDFSLVIINEDNDVEVFSEVISVDQTNVVVSVPTATNLLVEAQALAGDIALYGGTTSVAALAENESRPVSINLAAVLLQALNFDDAALALCVEDSGVSTIVNLEELNCRAYPIAQLGGIEQLALLKNLNLSANPLLDDLTPLSAVHGLQILNVAESSVTSILPLQSLANLVELDVSYTPLVNLNQIGQIANLSRLHISGLGLGDAALAELISNLPTLDNVARLTSLTVRDNELTTLGFAASLPNLQHIDVSANYNISSLTSLSNRGDLTGLGIGATQIRNVDFSQWPNLEFLALADLGIEEISSNGIAGLVQLRHLDLADNQKLGSIDELSNLSNLVFLSLANTNTPEIATGFFNNMVQLQTLSLAGNGMASLASLAGLGQLQVLDASLNDLSSLADLANLSQLRELNLQGIPSRQAGVTDLSPLAGLTQLQILNISQNDQIDSLAPLASLTDLNILHADGLLAVNEYSVLANLNELFELSLAGSNFTNGNLAPLSNKPLLHRLNLSESGVTLDLSTLVNVPLVNSLDLISTGVNDYSLLSNFSQLRRLNLAQSGFGQGDITALAPLTTLTELDLSANVLTDISVLSSLVNLTVLNLSSNVLDNDSLEPIAGLSALEELNVASNPLDSLANIDGLPNLRLLDLSNAGVSGFLNISSINNLTSLETLLLDGLSIANVSGAISGLVNLKVLSIQGADVNDASFLANLTELRHLDLSGNFITDLTPLAGLTELVELGLSNNSSASPLDLASLHGLTKLRDLRLSGNWLLDASQFDQISPLPQQLPQLQKLELIDVAKAGVDSFAPPVGLSTLSGFSLLKELDLSANDISQIISFVNVAELLELKLAQTQLDSTSCQDLVDFSNSNNTAVLGSGCPGLPSL